MSGVKLHVTALLVSIGFFILYTVTLSRHYTGDSIMFAAEVSTGDPHVMMPRHRMLVDTLGYTFVSLWDITTHTNSVLLPMQVFDALSGAVAVGWVFYTLATLTGSWVVALLSAVGFGASNGLWLFSIEAELVTPPLAQMLAVLSLSASLASTRLVRRTKIVWVGLAASFAILTYIESVLLIPVVVFALMSSLDTPIRQRLKEALLFLAVMCGLTAIAYGAYLYFIQGGLHGVTSLYGGQGSGLIYGTFSAANIPDGIYSFGRTVVNYPLIPVDQFSRTFWSAASWSSRLEFVAFELVVFGLIALPLGDIVVAWRSYPRNQQASILLIVLSSALFAGFAFFWVPKDMQFWLPVTAGFWLLFGIALARRVAGRVKSRWYGIGFMIVGVVMAVNFVGSVMPRQSLASNSNYWIALSAKEHTSTRDMIVTVSDNRYIPYFSERQTFSLLEHMLSASSAHSNDPKAGMFQQLADRMASIHQAGGKVFLYVDPLDADSLSGLRQIGLEPSDWQDLGTVPAWTAYGGEFVEIVGK